MDRSRRNAPRLQGYDYTSSGAYFVTFCTHRRAWLFDDAGLRVIAEEEWPALPEGFTGIQLDEWVVMPNHVHGIVSIGAGPAANAGRPTLSAIVGTFKSRVAVRWLVWLREHAPDRPGRIWQRGYYDRIIRNERELDAVRRYIRDNPRRWAEDRENLDALVERMDSHS